LDTAIAGLNEKDRHAIVLRFFQNKSLNEIGAALGASEEAAKKRVERALEKLQRYFTRQGVASTTAIVAGVISTNSVQAAPVAFAHSVTAAALAKGAVASSTNLTLIKGTIKLMAWTKQKGVSIVRTDPKGGNAPIQEGGTMQGRPFVALGPDGVEIGFQLLE
jgi:hypothetical protein